MNWFYYVVANWLWTVCSSVTIQEAMLKHGNWYGPPYAKFLEEMKMWILCFLLLNCQASTSIFRKYTGPVDIWLSIFFSHSYPGSRIYCLLNKCPSRSYLAMAEHSSQWVWYVYLPPRLQYDTLNSTLGDQSFHYIAFWMNRILVSNSFMLLWDLLERVDPLNLQSGAPLTYWFI